MSPIEHIRRTIFKVSQTKFAEIAEVSQATVSRWETGEFEPGLDEMRRIRNEALLRGLEWSDADFFNDPPPVAHDHAASKKASAA